MPLPLCRGQFCVFADDKSRASNANSKPLCCLSRGLIMLAAARNVVAARIRFDLSPCSRALIVTGPNRSGQKIRQTRIPRLFCCVRTTVTCVHAETRQFREFPPDVIKISLGGVRVSATDSTGFSLCAFVTFAVPRLCMFDRTAAREMVFFPRRTDRNSSCGYLVATVDL